MANHQEILRLESPVLNNTQNAVGCECARSTVIEVLRRAKEQVLRWPLPEDMTDRELANTLYLPVGKPQYLPVVGHLSCRLECIYVCQRMHPSLLHRLFPIEQGIHL